MKKVLSVLLCVLLMLPLAVPAFAAEGIATTTADKTTVKPGDEVVFSVSVDKAYSAKAVAIDFTNNNHPDSGFIWNTDVFEVATYEEDGDVYEKAEWAISVKKAKLNDVNLAEKGNAAIAFEEEKNFEGEIFTFTLKVKENAPLGQYTIAAGVSIGGTFLGERQGCTITVDHDCVLSTEYSKDADGHWYGCAVSGCNKPVSKLPHDFANACDELCDTCGYTRTTTHTESTGWTTDATFHWKTCTVCGDVVESTKAGHSGGSATCQDLAVCVDCNTPYGSHVDHHYTETVDPQYKVSDATCIAPAKYYKSCEFCGIADTATFEYGTVDSTKHLHTEIRDAVKESCNTSGYTGDTWCKDCNTKIDDGKAIDPTGAHVDADDKWETNGTQHFHTCACGTEFDKAAHTGGEATCKDKAVCSVCEAAYGELNADNHVGETEIRDAVKESCNTSGYTGDTYCKDCNAKIDDGKTIDPTGAHVDADDKWESNGTQHFHTCACGTEFDKADHTGGEATCKDKAVCSVCEAAYGELNADNHKNTEIRDAVKESCNTPGYTGDTYCKDCNAKIDDGKAIDPTGAHVDADNKWESNGTQHFHTCECGTEFDKAAHTGGEATCKDKAVCSVCGAAYGELNADNHVGETEIRGAASAKCNEEGYTGDTYCKDCNTKIADGKKIDKIPHVVKEWTVSKEATTEATGLKTGTCSGCNETMTVETAKLVEAIKPENIEGTDAKVEIVGDSNISENVIFKAEEVLGTIVKEEKEKVDNAVKTAVEKFEEIKENAKIGAIFDFNLILRETNTNGEVIGETNLKLEGKVKVTVPVPETMLNTLENLKLLHIKDDGTVEIVPFTLAEGKATFEATGFSYYTFVGTEKQVAPTTPQTGDNSNIVLWSALAFVSLVTLGGIVVIKKREGNRA